MSRCTTTLIHSPPERDRTGQAEREVREGETDVSRETRDSETGQTGGSGGQVRQARQARQVGSTQVVQVGLWSGLRSDRRDRHSGGQWHRCVR